MLIEHLPPILIIHLKCFLYDETDGIKKLNKSVNYTVNLTLPKGNTEVFFLEKINKITFFQVY
jgi:hypothetical protein